MIPADWYGPVTLAPWTQTEMLWITFFIVEGLLILLLGLHGIGALIRRWWR